MKFTTTECITAEQEARSNAAGTNACKFWHRHVDIDFGGERLGGSSEWPVRLAQYVDLKIQTITSFWIIVLIKSKIKKVLRCRPKKNFFEGTKSRFEKFGLFFFF